MKLWDQAKCRRCGHWRMKHTAEHPGGSKTACYLCYCKTFKEK
jgi:hypothetical protein